MSWSLVFLALWMAFRLILTHAIHHRSLTTKSQNIPTVSISSEKH